MPQQEVFFEEQAGDRLITVLKSYDRSYAREVFGIRIRRRSRMSTRTSTRTLRRRVAGRSMTSASRSFW